MPHNELRLLTLGRLALVHGPAAEEVPGCQRRRLALLAYLGVARRAVERDQLVEMFWGDEEDERARHSLSNALSFLRHVIGADFISARRADIALSPGAGLTVDAVELRDAAKTNDHTRVIELYAGPFLGSIYIPGSETFEQWASTERTRIDLAFTKACDAGCMRAAADRDWERCATFARRWLEMVPTSPEAALHLLNALRASHTPDGRRAALAEFARLSAQLTREYGATPAAAVVALAQKIAQRVEADNAAAAALALEPEVAGESTAPVHAAPVHAAPVDTIVSAAPVSAAPDALAGTSSAAAPGDAAAPSTPPRLSRVLHHIRAHPTERWAASLAVLLTVMGLGGYGLSRAMASARVAGPSGPAIVVTDIADLGHDTASAWLENGFVQMLASDVAREANVNVVTPSRVRDTRTRAELGAAGTLPPGAALDIARRLGATLAVRGGFTRGPTMFVLDLAVLDVNSGRTVQSFTVTGADPITLAAQAAGRIIDGSSTDAARVRFAGVETSNVLAYQHFIRALQADAAGRIGDERDELDATIALDSGFADAIIKRRDIAVADGQPVEEARLTNALRHARFTPWDAQIQAINSTLRSGELTRAEQLARGLVQQYPRDPRAYSILGAVLYDEGNWAAAQTTYEQQLALDSLAIGAGDGPCAPCSAYEALTGAHTSRGDLIGGERAAQQWVQLQPDLPRAWSALSATLNYAGRYDAAIDAQRRAMMLSGNEHYYAAPLARLLIGARRLHAAELMAHSWTATPARFAAPQEAALADQVDIDVQVQRERGQLQASIRTIEAYEATHNPDDALRLEEIDALGRLGDYAGVERVFRAHIGDESSDQLDPPASGERARWFCWTRAVKANALAEDGDTLRLKSLADSIRAMSALSYYGRDRRLYHHVLGLVAFAGRRYREAEQDFAAARWGVAGWTETVAWQARAELADKRPRDAITTLRQGYEGPLDAMGRYEPRSELDYLMALAFTRAGERDSAAVYAGYSRAALHSADPEVMRRLATLVPRT